MAINKVVYGNNTLIDLTSDTVASDNLLEGYVAHNKSGEVITGTAGAYVQGTVLHIPSSQASVTNNILKLL